jgi:hypothetical protein
MSKKFQPNLMLDEQMYFDATNTLLYQIREELKENNRLLQKQSENEPKQPEKIEKNEKPSKVPKKSDKEEKAPSSEKE